MLVPRLATKELCAMEFKKTGKCWCGCGEDTGHHFKQGHDRRAETVLLGIVYGGLKIGEILAMLGYSPDSSVDEAKKRLLGVNG